MSKLYKFIRKPEVFLRDYLIKRNPLYLGSYNYNKYDIVVSKVNDEKSSFYNNVDYPIDIVYTWVNDNDQDWQLKKNKYKELFFQSDTVFEEGCINNRFTNHNEIFYSVLSVHKFLSWVRKIFIVTDHQIPCLPSTDKIVIINHEDIIDSKWLPTFNSHVIEAHLHNIPDLSNHFIYFNDDIFVARRLQKYHFFRSNELSSIFLSNRSIKEQISRKRMTPTLQATLNSQKLLAKYFNVSSLMLNKPLLHTYVPLNKEIFKQCYDIFYREITKFLCNKFRSKNDLNLATFFVPYFMYLKRMSTETIDISYYTNLNSSDIKFFLENLYKLKETSFVPHSFCINDVQMKKQKREKTQNVMLLKNYLDKYYGV